MIRQDDQWQGIPSAEPGTPPTMRRADPDHPLNFFRARDADGRHTFILKLNSSVPLDDLPLLGGVDMTPYLEEGEVRGLMMVLTSEPELSIFRAFTEDLLSATADLNHGEEDAGARRVVNRILRWHELLKRRQSSLMSRKKIIGLIGELLFLRSFLLPVMSASEALVCWRGPHSDEQDFVVNGTIIEIKTQLSTADKMLKISSEAQLDISSGPIVLCHQTISAAGSSGSETFSLNEIVDELKEECRNNSTKAIDLFEAGLLAVGYQERDEYDREHWQPGRFTPYEVAENFPRLVPAVLPAGVRQVRYNIEPSTCIEFLRDSSWLEEIIDGGI